jgi:hypothetical protein
MSEPISLLADAVGFARDHALDAMPRGLMWDMADYLPNRRGARLEGRGPWPYFSTALAGNIWGGKHAAFRAGVRLYAGAAGSLYDVNLSTGAISNVGAVPIGVQNGVMLGNHLYFSDATGVNRPKFVFWNGSTTSITELPASAPPGSVMCSYKGRLLLAGVADATKSHIVYFSPLQTDQGPLGTWDAKSFIGSARPVSALAPMTGQVLVFHHGSIEKIRGGIPPGENLESDMYQDVFSEEVGTDEPASVVPWQENYCFANPHGVYLTDGATIRSLTEQGGISNLWRALFQRKKAGTHVHACVFKNMLMVTVLTTWTTSTAEELRPMTLVCDLPTRTWYRLKNVHATCYIDSMEETEEVWWGCDASVPTLGENRLVKVSPLFFGNTEFDPSSGSPTAPDAVDGNGLPVLPVIRTPWFRMGPEGVKRLRHVYVSHLTQAQTQTRPDVHQVGVRISPYPNLDPVSVGKLPAASRYTRKRLRVDRRGYGIQVEVEQVLPSYLTRLYDIAVDEWPQDRAKL